MIIKNKEMWILSAILYTVISLVALLVIKDLVTYLRYKTHYSGQGIKFFFTPVVGITGASVDIFGDDILGGIKKLFKKDFKGEEIVASNEYHKSNVILNVISPDLIREFLLKDIDVAKKLPIVDSPFDMGFFFEEGHKALEKRAIFNEFFKPYNLKNITPKIQEIIEEQFSNLRQKLWGSDKESELEYKELDMKYFMAELFNEVVNEILFGSDDYPLVNGFKMPEFADSVMADQMSLMMDPLNLVTLGVLNKYNVHPINGKIKKKMEALKTEIHKVLERRAKRTDEELGVNMIDLMIKHNRKCKESEVMDNKMMASNVTLFQITGVDTTQNSTKSLIKVASIQTDIGKRITEEEIPKIFKTDEDWLDYDNYEKSDFLNQVIDETLRLYCPAPATFPRQITKNFKLGSYNLRKGDIIYIPIIAIQSNESLFKDPSKFDTERFSSENKAGINRHSYLPFYSGRRACLGKYLAQLLLRMIILNLFKRFEIKSNGKKLKTFITFGYGVKECSVMIRPLQE